MSKKQVIIILVLIIVLGAALRFINLGHEPYWGDEVLSLDIVKHYVNDVSGMIAYLNTVEVHPPLYYLVLNVWTKALGWEEFGVRLLSLIFGLGVIFLTYWLYNLLFKDKKMALLAAFFIAILPFQIEFSQEARPYIMYCFMALLAAISYWQYRENQRLIFIPVYVAATLAGLFLHYSYVFFATALALYWLLDILVQRPGNLGRKILLWLGVHSFIFLAFWRQITTALYKIFLGNYLLFNTARANDGGRLPDFFESVTSQLIWMSKNAPISKLEVLVILLFKLTIIAGAIWLIFKSGSNLVAKIRQDKHPLVFIVWLLIVPLALFLVSPYSISYAPIYERHIIFSSVFIIFLLCYVIGYFDFKKKLVLSSLFLLSIMNPLIIVLGDDSLWDTYFRLKSVADQVNINYRPGDVVLVADTIARSDVNHFLQDDIPSISLYPLELIDYHYDFLGSRETLGLGENEAQLRYAGGQKSYNISLQIKMDYLVKKYQPQRIWYMSVKDYNVQKWFDDNHWRLAMDSLGHLHPLKLYAAPSPALPVSVTR